MSRARWRLALGVSLTIALIGTGAVLVRDATAVPATSWMHMFSPGDFPTTGDLITYLRTLRVPIPPVISALEIISVQRSGSTAPVTTGLYRISLVGAYVLALWLSYPSLVRLVASFLTSVVFLWATTLIHPSNPQIYDILFPFFVLLFLLLLRSVPAVRSTGSRVGLALGAGFFLSMAELARPFVVLFVPFALAGAYFHLRRYGRHVFVAVLIPLGLLSGVWHLHLLATHGQLLSTNYSGFNLRRAWPNVPLGPTVQETRTRPPDDRRWPSVNTEEQYRASQFLQHTIFAYLLDHPLEALHDGALKVVDFTAGRPSMPDAITAPGGTILSIYSRIVRASVVFLLANVGALVWYAVGAKRRAYLILATPENLLLLIAVGSLLVLSLGEAGEGARLLLSILPFLAAYPVARRVGSDEVTSPAFPPSA